MDELKKYNGIELIKKGNSMEVTLELSPIIKKIFTGEPLCLEIEMLQGKSYPLKDGMTRYVFTVTDPEKMRMLEDFAVMMFSVDYFKSRN
jgi:hypothetical protein